MTGIAPWPLVLLGAVTALGPLSIDLYLPGFPDLAAELHSSEAAVQLTLTACVVGLAIGQPVAGPLSDAFGRRAPIVVGLLAWSVASVACALAPSIATLTALRFSQGLAGSAGMVVARAVLRDGASGDQLTRAFARLMLVVGVVPIAAPTVGGLLLQVTDWRGLFLVLSALGAALTLTVMFGLRETLPPSRRRAGGLPRAMADYRALLRDRSFLGPALVVSLTFAALFSYVSASSFLLRGTFVLSAAEFGFQFGVNSVALIAGTQVSARLARRLAPSTLLAAALCLGVGAALLMLGSAATGAFGYAGVSVPLAVFVLAIGVAMPVATAQAMNGHPERAGAASGLLGVFQFLVGGAIAPLVGLLRHGHGRSARRRDHRVRGSRRRGHVVECTIGGRRRHGGRSWRARRPCLAVVEAVAQEAYDGRRGDRPRRPARVHVRAQAGTEPPLRLPRRPTADRVAHVNTSDRVPAT